MPYDSNGDLPTAANRYSDHCKTVFRRAFNSAFEQYNGDEGRAMATAHAAAKKCMEAKALDVLDKPKTADFKIFSAALEPVSSSDGKRRLRTIASSSVEDLGGDEISPKALEAMVASAKGMTIFRNHSYKVPDDILGYVEHAETKNAGLDGNGKPITDLVLDIVVRDEAKSVETYDAIASGVKLGTSIGAKIIAEEATRKPNGGYLFDGLNLLEASIVGIPQNPRSWVQYATKAWQAIEAEDDDEETNDAFHEASAEPDTAKTVWVETSSGDKVTVGEPIENVETNGKSKKKDAEPEIVKDDAPTPESPEEAEIADDAEEINKQPAEAGDEVEKSAEADVLKAETDDDPTPAQEVVATSPEHADDAADTSAVVADTVTRSAEVLADIVKDLTGENGRLRKAVEIADAARDAAVTRADDAEANLTVARSIVKALYDSPLGRKAQFAEQIDEFDSKFGGIYSPAVVKMLENTKHGT